MSAGLRNTTIETFRKRAHGNQVLRLYKLNADGESLSTLSTISKGFFIGRNTDTSQGAYDSLLTIDTVFSPSLNEPMFDKMAFVDLINPDNGVKRRYRINTDGKPLPDGWRYVFGLHAAFNDTKTVV